MARLFWDVILLNYKWSRGNLDVITGNRAHLTRTLEWYNNRKKRENLIVIETLLDADDGMHHEGIAGIQEFAVEHTHVILQQKQEQQDRQHMRTNPTVKTESSSPSSSPIRDWWILCGTDHIEWHNRDVYTLKRDEHKKVGITSGVVGIRLKPKECISAGYTRIGLVTENFKDTTKSRSRSRSSNVAHSDFPLAASRNHFIATREYPPCAMNVVTHCYHRFFVDKPLTVRTRSITSDGMTHLDPKMNGYNMKTATIPDTEFETSKGEEVWRLLQHEFFIDRYEAYQTSIFLFERRIDILAENEKGRCIPGFPCNKVATDIHKSLKMTITDGSDRLLDTRVQAKSRLVLMTAVFGVSPLPVYFPVFLRSIQASGADGIVIGGDEMELKDSLPPNVRHIPMTWNGLHNLISYKLFGGDPLPGFQAANGYKVNDVKPLYGFLFRENIQEYEFWAHVDNDMIFGDVARFMNPMMDKFDIISALGRGQADCGLKNPCKITHGPFTAYRNVPEITELFRLIEVNLYETLNTAQAYGVDEWGGLRKRLGTNNVGSNDYLRSMSHVIHKYRHILPIRVGSAVPFACAYYSEHACDCIWTTSDGASSHLNANGRDVVFCHFLKTKHTAAKRLLEMPKNDREAIFHATSVMWSKEHGISIVDDGKGGGVKLDSEKNLGTKNQGNATSSLPVDDHHANPTSNKLDTKNNDSNRGGESPLQITHKTGTKMLNDWELRQPTAIRLHDARSAFVKKRHQCVEAIRNRHKVISDLLKPFLPQIIKDGSQYHPKVILVDPAYHANVGDHMLTLGEFVFLRGLGVHPLEEVIQCGPDHQHKVALCHSLKWWTDPNAEKLPALSHAGGNWGDLWPRHQKLRNQMIKMYAERNMLLISMPQSLYYENKDFEREDSMTIEESLTSGEINNQNVSKSTNIYLLWREKFSLTEANRLYPHATNILMPDIAFQLGPYEAQPLSSSDPRSVDIVFFLRDDKESVHSTDRNPVRIREMLIALGGAEGEKSTFIIVDWIDRLKMFNSSNFLFTDTAIKMLSAGRVLICDRLHASILSYLSGIPFIFLDQLTGKLSKSLSVALTSAEGCSDGSLGMFARATNLTQAIELALEFLATGHFRPDPTTTTSWTVTN
jgi:exopolysaccharide biosynthesis predicted pyruvyltransferase EpsI